MVFEVIDTRDGKTKASTTSESCIYPVETLRAMEKAGYIFKLDGKKYSPPKRGKGDFNVEEK